jgi:hypothetical protein
VRKGKQVPTMARKMKQHASGRQPGSKWTKPRRRRWESRWKVHMVIYAMREWLVKTLTFCLLTDAGCIITHHHGCID